MHQDGHTALMRAVKDGHTEVMTQLLEMGANIDCADKVGNFSVETVYS